MLTLSNPRLRACLCLGAFLVFCAMGRAQLIQVQGGSSDLLQAQGGQVRFESRNYQAYGAAGEVDGQLLFGSYLQSQFRDYKYTLGDNPVYLNLPTDIFDSGHYILTRGAGITTKKHNVNIFGFAGASAIGAGAPFFQAARSETATGMFFVQAPLTEKLTVYSKSVISDRQTSIQGVDWRPASWLEAGASAGIGANQKYAALSAKFDYDWISVKAAYIDSGNRFRRFTVQSPISSE